MNALFRFTLVVAVFLTAVTSFTNAQNIEITIRDNKRSQLPGATVQLKSLADSTVTYRTTGQKGIAEFTKINNGPYLVTVSFVGFETLERTITVKYDKREFSFMLKESTIALNEVTVAAKKPAITQEDDKMIIDPEPMISISTNTLEVLENTPGLYVDQDGGIYLNSATPAVVYINGREQKMAQQDVMSILRSLPPGSVQRIEVLRTPSTRYDAASSGGIINIVLKKGVKLGRFGTLNAGMNQGKYGNQFAGISFNNSGEKSTSYVNINYNRNDMLEELNSLREMKPDTLLTQSAATRKTSDQGYVGYGISYDLRDSLTLSYDGRINTSFQLSDALNTNTIRDAEETALSQSDNRIVNDIDFLSLQQDFGLIRKFDTLGSEWDTKFSYSLNSNKSIQDYSTGYKIPVEATIDGEGKSRQHRSFLVFQSDLTWLFKKDLKLETGVKSSFQQFSSTSDYLYNFGGILINDTQRTSSFNHTEMINAAYLQGSIKLPLEITLKSGLRMEHTYMNGRQTVPVDTGFLVNRADLFPYLYLSRQIIDMFDIKLFAYLIYRRTISRPGYDQLNPYIRYIDQFLYETGNPELKPQFTDNIEANISYEEWPVFAIGRNYTTDIFSNVVYRDKVNDNISVMTYDNLGKNTETYFRGMAGIPPGRVYFFGAGAQYNLTEYDGMYEGQPLQFIRGSWRFFTFHSIKVAKNTKIHVSGFMMHRGLFNFYELNTFGSLNVGIRQQLLKDRLTISINMRDILRTMVTEFELTQGSQRTSGDRYTDSQRWGINVRYNFGLSAKEDKKMPGQFESEE